MANMAAAGRVMAFETIFNKIDLEFKAALVAADFTRVLEWSTYFEKAPGADWEECLQIADGLGATAAQRRAWAEQAANLHELAAGGLAQQAARRVASIRGYDLTADLLHHERCAERRAVKRDPPGTRGPRISGAGHSTHRVARQAL